MDKLDPYVTKQGENEPRLPSIAASPLQQLVMLSNPHPVKVRRRRAPRCLFTTTRVSDNLLKWCAESCLYFSHVSYVAFVSATTRPQTDFSFE